MHSFRLDEIGMDAMCAFIGQIWSFNVIVKDGINLESGVLNDNPRNYILSDARWQINYSRRMKHGTL